MFRCKRCMNEYSEEFDMCPFCGTERDEKQKEMYFLPLGTLVQNRYEIGLCCGSGGFGITYRAWDRTLSKMVAIKEYYPVGLVNRIPGEKEIIIYSGSRKKEFLAGKDRFLEEARNMAKFSSHPNIINVYDFFEENSTAYIVMEFLDGSTYKEYMKQFDGHPISTEYAVNITLNVLNALTEVHKAGILHRDISPDNVFITKEGRVKLIDFGAARFSSTEEALTRSIIMKPGYAPPEQYKTKSKQGPWTDIYAVGAMLFRAVTGVVPDESVNRVEQDTLPDPMRVNGEVSLQLNNAILRAMSLEPELRFKDSKEFINALTGDNVVKDTRRELKRRKKIRIISITAGSVLAIAGIIICLGVTNKRKNEAAVLEECSVSMWVPVKDEVGNSQTQAIFEEALREYRNVYPQVDLSIEYIPESEYDSKILDAMSTDTLPTLFDSTKIPEKQLSNVYDLSSITDYVNQDEVYLAGSAFKTFTSKEKFPTSCIVPVVYYNTTLTETSDSADDVKDALTAERQQNIDAFLNGDAPCLIGDVTQYEAVQEELAGIYRLEVLKDGGTIQFCDCYSISDNCPRKEKEAALQIIVYMLSQTAQDVQYVQNGKSLPLNKSIFAEYINVNREFMGMDEYLTEMKIEGE